MKLLFDLLVFLLTFFFMAVAIGIPTIWVMVRLALWYENYMRSMGKWDCPYQTDAWQRQVKLAESRLTPEQIAYARHCAELNNKQWEKFEKFFGISR